MTETDHDADELQMLSSARRGLSPSVQDRERVLAATLAGIAATHVGAGAGAGAVHAAKGGSGDGGVWLATPSSKLVAALAIGVLSGAIGYYAGYSNASRSTHPLPPVVQSVKTPAATPTQARVDAVSQAVKAALPVAAAAAAASSAKAHAVIADVDEAAAPVLPAPSLAHGVSQRAASARTPAQNAEPSAVDVASDLAIDEALPSLEQEVRAMRRVERSLREEQPALALRVLAELDRTVPVGKLGEERLAAFVMARCALALGTPESLIALFTSAYPKSAYRARVEHNCKESK